VRKMKKGIITFLLAAILVGLWKNEGKGAYYSKRLTEYPIDICLGPLGSTTISPGLVEIRVGGTHTFQSNLYTALGGTLTPEVLVWMNRKGSITYSWSATGGIITPIDEGRYAIYTAPSDSEEEGTYSITVIVQELPVKIQDPRLGIFYDISTQTITVVATAMVVVKAREITTVRLEPSSLVLVVAGTATCRLIVEDQWGDPMLVEGTFSTNIGSVSPVIGTETTFNAQIQSTRGWIRAQVGKLVATSTVTLNPGSLYKIVVDPSSATLNLNESKKFEGKGYDKYGNIIPDLSYNWTTDDDSLGTLATIIGTSTVFNATNTGSGGTVTLQANVGTVIGTATIVIKGNFIKRIETQSAGVPFRIEVNICGFEGEATLISSLEGVLGTITIDESGRGEGTVTLYKAGTQTISCGEGTFTIASNLFVVNPDKIATFTVDGFPGLLIAGRPFKEGTITVSFWDQWGNKAITPSNPPSRTQIWFSGVIIRNGVEDDASIDIIDLILAHNDRNKRVLPPGRTEVYFPRFFIECQDPRIDSLITEDPNTWMEIHANLHISNY